VVDIRAFRGLRPRPELAGEVACPPYDVLGEEEARALAAGHPGSFVRVIRAEVDLAPGVDARTETVHRRAAENLESLVAEGVLVRDPNPCLYLYRLKQDAHVQHGLVAGFAVDDYQAGRIRRHEQTRPDKEDDRTGHIETVGAQAGPVLLAYRHQEWIDALVAGICQAAPPAVAFADEEDVEHALWPVDDRETIDALRSAFARVERVYIADGHHRAAAAARVRDRRGGGAADHFLAVAFPGRELRILGYHRLVRDLNGLDPDDFLREVQRHFVLEPAGVPPAPAPDGRLPGGPGRFGMFLEGRWYRLRVRPDHVPAGDPVRSLDASLLQELLLRPVLGIGDPRTDPRIDFAGGPRGPDAIEQRVGTDMRVGFCLHPVSLDQLMQVADAGASMPPKSTWFEPKLRSGLVVRPLEGESP